MKITAIMCLPENQHFLLRANMKGGVHEECIICTTVWQKMHFLGWSDIKQQKIKPVALMIVDLKASGRQTVSH